MLKFDVLAQSQSGDGAGAAILIVLYLAVLLVTVAGMWKVLEKANQPGWGILIPIYNLVVLLRIAGRPLWWVVLMFIPLISLIPAIAIPFDVAKNFGKGAGYGLGLLFLPFIFYPMLGFGPAEYSPTGIGSSPFAQPMRAG